MCTAVYTSVIVLRDKVELSVGVLTMGECSFVYLWDSDCQGAVHTCGCVFGGTGLNGWFSKQYFISAPPRPARDVNSMRAGILLCAFTVPFVSRIVPNTQ